MYGHVGKVNIQTYVLKRCMLEGTRMRKFRKANIMTSDWGRLPSASEWPLEAREEVTQCKTECKDER